jgi:transcriptional regulator with XRE-family HTH domain
VAYYRDTELLVNIGRRIRLIRETADLSQEQVYYATKIGQSNIAKLEVGKLNTSISQLSLLAKFFGLELSLLIDTKQPIPEFDSVKRGISRFLKKNDIDENIFFRKKLSRLIETRLIPGKFFNSPKTAKDIAEHLNIEYSILFSTPHISQSMEGFRKRGLIEKLPTDKKSKFQYRKK